VIYDEQFMKKNCIIYFSILCKLSHSWFELMLNAPTHTTSSKHLLPIAKKLAEKSSSSSFKVKIFSFFDLPNLKLNSTRESEDIFYICKLVKNSKLDQFVKNIL
jgi:hypothetical protein